MPTIFVACKKSPFGARVIKRCQICLHFCLKHWPSMFPVPCKAYQDHFLKLNALSFFPHLWDFLSLASMKSSERIPGSVKPSDELLVNRSISSKPPEMLGRWCLQVEGHMVRNISEQSTLANYCLSIGQMMLASWRAYSQEYPRKEYRCGYCPRYHGWFWSCNSWESVHFLAFPHILVAIMLMHGKQSNSDYVSVVNIGCWSIPWEWSDQLPFSLALTIAGEVFSWQHILLVSTHYNLLSKKSMSALVIWNVWNSVVLQVCHCLFNHAITPPCQHM